MNVAPARRVAVTAVSALALVAALLSATEGSAAAAPTLLSQGKTATASSTENAMYPASAAVDGNTTTRWSSAFSDPQWLQVDLGTLSSVSQVVLSWEAAYATSFQIQVSTDAATWTTIYSTTTGAGGTQTLPVTGSGRFVRVLGTARATKYGYSLYEFQVYGNAVADVCNAYDDALNKAATASSTASAGTPASAAVDGNAGTGWSSAAGFPQWIQIDLGRSFPICQVILEWGAAYATAFQIQLSQDATAWTTIYSTTTGTGGTQTLNVGGTGRYLRVNCAAGPSPSGCSLLEIIVHTGDLAPTPPAPSRYAITDLGSFAGDYSDALAINNAGVVVGNSYATPGIPHAFRWTAGTLTDLGIEPAGQASWANGINDAGQVAGTADRSVGGYAYPATWSASGVLTDLGGPVTNRLGVGNGIDPSGRVVGGQRAADSEGGPNAILYDQAGNPTNLGNPPDSLNAATAINARGQVVGSPAFVWQSGTLTMLPPIPGGFSSSSIATAINVGGQVVGAANNAANTGQDAVIWRNGAITDLGTIDGILTNEATGINAAGQVVGTADPGCSPCPSAEAWIWQQGSVMTRLDTLIPSGSGWTLQAANGINDRGQIVGTGLHNGHQRAFLLTPSYAVNVNFGPAGSTVPTGYALDAGAAYGARTGGLSYGWNIDNAVNTRDRDSASSPDQRYDTLIHMQRTGSATVWEIAVPNGRYTVHIVSGDPTATDSTYKINVEGVLVLSGVPTAASPWIEGSALVTVSDGRLTVTNGTGSSNDKLNYIDVIAS